MMTWHVALTSLARKKTCNLLNNVYTLSFRINTKLSNKVFMLACGVVQILSFIICDDKAYQLEDLSVWFILRLHMHSLRGARAKSGQR